MAELVYVSVGSNIERCANLRLAIEALRAQFNDLSLSPVYESAAEGFDGPAFYNLVLTFYANGVLATRSTLKNIELAQKRAPQGSKFSDRTLDLDILLFGEHILYDQQLDIPRREILEYAFVLRPLADLAPNSIHPIAAKNYAELWQQFTIDKPVGASSLTVVPFDW